MRRLWALYLHWTPFSEEEAWHLFRLAAITEAVGWSLLISGILISKYLTPGNDLAVQLAGRFHGTFFLCYVLAVLVFAPSQGWSFRRLLAAGLASVPPYGSLLFEQWAAHRRRRRAFRQLAVLSAYQFALAIHP